MPAIQFPNRFSIEIDRQNGRAALRAWSGRDSQFARLRTVPLCDIGRLVQDIVDCGQDQTGAVCVLREQPTVLPMGMEPE